MIKNSTILFLLSFVCLITGIFISGYFIALFAIVFSTGIMLFDIEQRLKNKFDD